MPTFHTAHAFFPERGENGEWVGFVYTEGFFGRKTIHTTGCMGTEQGIKLWLARVVRTRAWETNSEPADMYGTKDNPVDPSAEPA